MYSYYFFSTINIKVPWGPLVTKAQQIQFVTMISQGAYVVFFGCPYPNRIAVFYVVYILSLLVLFRLFDMMRWAKPAAKKDAKKQ